MSFQTVYSNNNNKNGLFNIASQDQLIRFPTITRLTYAGDAANQTQTTFKPQNIRSIIKNSSPPFLGQTMNMFGTFRVVEVPPDDQIIKISMMSIKQHEKYRTVYSKDIDDKEEDEKKKLLVNYKKMNTRSTSLFNNLNFVSASKQKEIQENNTIGITFKNRGKVRTQSVLKVRSSNKFSEGKLNITEIYSQVISALAVVNGKVIINQTKNFHRIRRAKIEKGNNGALIRQTVKKRPWWNVTEDIDDANLVWTEKSLKFRKKNNQEGQASQQKIEETIIFQRNIDQAFFTYPKMLQLFFTDDQICPISALNQKQTSKSKISYVIHNYLSNKKARRRISPEQVIIYNHIPNHSEITSKKMLYKNLWRYYHERKLDPYNHIPKTYHLTAFDWQQKIEFLKSETKGITHTAKKDQGPSFKSGWFLKPGQNTNRGHGIHIFNDTSEVIDYILRNPPKSIQKTYILQEYINPLLYDQRKFDIRCYMLCIQAFETQVFYWYEQGYIRTSSSKFTMKKTSACIHLTNDAVQKQFDNYDKYQSANKLSYLEIDKYIQNEYGFQFLNKIVPKMKKIGTDICKSAVEMGRKKVRGESQNDQENSGQNVEGLTNQIYDGIYFEVFGLDFIISKKGDPYLLQVNTNPCLEINSNLLSRIIPEMIENTFRILIDVYLPNKSSNGNLTPDWAHNFVMNNKFSLLYRRELAGENHKRIRENE